MSNLKRKSVNIDGDNRFNRSSNNNNHNNNNLHNPWEVTLPTPLRKSQKKSKHASVTYEQILLSTQKTGKKHRSRISRLSDVGGSGSDDNDINDQASNVNIRLMSEKRPLKRKRYDYVEPPSFIQDSNDNDNDSNDSGKDNNNGNNSGNYNMNGGSHDTSFNLDNGDGSNEEMNILRQDFEYRSCSHIIAFISNFCDIIQFNLYLRAEYFIPILKFTIPVLKNKFACQAMSLEQILSITHEWYEIKFMGKKSKRRFGGLKNRRKFKNKKLNKKRNENERMSQLASKSGIEQLSEEELKEIAQVLVNLQTQVLTATYDNRNYVAEILKYKQALKTNKFHTVVNDSNDDMIDID